MILRLSQPTRIFLALLIGLAAGIAAAWSGASWVERSAAIAEPIGGMWLNALQMTIVPLVISLIVTGIAGAAEAAPARRLAAPPPVLVPPLPLPSSLPPP